METLNPDAEIDLRERKISGARTTTYAMRRSRVALEAKMTGPMLDAERDIAAGWTIRAGHMGYGSHDPTRVRGRSERDEDRERAVVVRLVAWMEKCPKMHREIVLDIAVYAKTIRDITAERNINRFTVMRRFYKGLDFYCEQQGWMSRK